MLRSLPYAALALLFLTVAGCGSGSSSNSAAATVNGQTISMVSYSKQVAYKRWVTEQEDGNVDVCATPGYQVACQQLKRTALDELIAGVLVQQYANSHHIVITQADYNRQWLIFFKQKFHSNTAVLNAYAKNLGLTAADVKNLVRQNTLDNAVMYHVTAHMPAQVPATRVARVVTSSASDARKLRLDLKTMTFGRVIYIAAHETVSACSTIGCGEVGWIPNSLLSGGDRAVINAPVGSVVGPVPAPDNRYIIFRVEGHSTHFTPPPAQQLQMREQIFAQWLLTLHKQAAIRTYVTT